MGCLAKALNMIASKVRDVVDGVKTAAEINQLSITSVDVAERAGAMLTELVPDIQKTSELAQKISAAGKGRSEGARTGRLPCVDRSAAEFRARRREQWQGMLGCGRNIQQKRGAGHVCREVAQLYEV